MASKGFRNNENKVGFTRVCMQYYMCICESRIVGEHGRPFSQIVAVNYPVRCGTEKTKSSTNHSDVVGKSPVSIFAVVLMSRHHHSRRCRRDKKYRHVYKTIKHPVKRLISLSRDPFIFTGESFLQ